MTRSGLRRVRALSAPEVVFVVALVVAIPVLRWTNRDQWFFLDEWDFLSDRSIGDLGGLFRPHNGHWALLPILVYRGLFAVFGLHHYWPYQAVTIALHLTLAVCMRALIRRAGADPWLATAGAMLFIGLGSGRANIGWAFQMGFAGSVTLGLGQMLVADHDGVSRRHDLVALGLGLAAIMTHGPGVALVAGTGAVVWLRRGWRPAAFQVLPLAVVFLGWAVVEHPMTSSGERAISEVLRFAGTMPVRALESVAQHDLVALSLAAVTVIGGVVLIRRSAGALATHPASILLGPIVAAGVFCLSTAWGRAGTSFTDGPGAGRYVHVLAALLLPLPVVAASELVRGRAVAWRYGAAVLLLAGLPGNLARLEPQGLERFTLGRPRHWSALGQVVRTDPAPAGHHPEPFEAREVTVGWLRSVEREGKMPILSLTPAEVADAEVSLAIRQVDLPASRNCRRTGSTQTVRLSRREVLAVDSPRLAVSLVRDGRIGGSTSFLAWDEESVAVAPVDRSLVLRLDPQTVRSGRPRVCQ